MAKIEVSLKGQIDDILNFISDGIVNGSFSAQLVDSSNFVGANSRCAVLVFERYSYTGKNRVSLTVTLYQERDGAINLSGITSGGSQGLFFKFNTIPEDAFLEKLVEIVQQISR